MEGVDIRLHRALEHAGRQQNICACKFDGQYGGGLGVVRRKQLGACFTAQYPRPGCQQHVSRQVGQ